MRIRETTIPYLVYANASPLTIYFHPFFSLPSHSYVIFSSHSSQLPRPIYPLPSSYPTSFSYFSSLLNLLIKINITICNAFQVIFMHCTSVFYNGGKSSATAEIARVGCHYAA